VRVRYFVNQANAVMKPEVPEIDQDKAVSPQGQEIEFALILSRMINTVKEDPSQMRLAIYEFARARLAIDAEWADEAERKRLAGALETAIHGVERFSVRLGDQERLQPPIPPAQIGPGTAPAEPPTTSMVTIEQPSAAARTVRVPEEIYWVSEAEPVAELRTRMAASTLVRLGIGIVLFGVVAGLAVYKQLAGVNLASPIALTAARPVAPPSGADPQPPLASDVKTAAASSSAPPFPLPSDYGVYALNNASLSELHLLPEQVPDKRVAMSTPVSQPSSTTLPDGKAKFVLFRRDLAGNAPDRVDVRVVARVVRALTFDTKGKASFVPVSDAWNIRNISYAFRVRPIAGNPEMLLIQAENADFALPSGRYVLVLGTQGYDFTVTGKVTDASQCLERTDAANGAFYSDCQKQKQ
jgi:hypothetical protein